MGAFRFSTTGLLSTAFPVYRYQLDERYDKRFFIRSWRATSDSDLWKVILHRGLQPCHWFHTIGWVLRRLLVRKPIKLSACSWTV
jgi:hypothetical protein